MGRIVNFETKTNYCSHLLVGFKINAHATRSLGPSKAQGRQGKTLYGWHNVARTCDLLSAKLEVTYQRNGFLVRLRGGSGIVCTKFERKDQQTIKSSQIKSKQLSPPIRRQKRNSST